MSLDLSNHSSDSRSSGDNVPRKQASDSPHSKDQWKSLRKKIRVKSEKLSLEAVFGKAAKKGSVYRWGVAVATKAACTPIFSLLTRLAAGDKVTKNEVAEADLEKEFRQLTDRFSSGTPDSDNAIQALVWAAAMPELIDHLDYRVWWEMLSELQQIRELSIEKSSPSSLTRLILAGEMGLTLAWRLADLPSCKRLQTSSVEVVMRWCQSEDDSVSQAIAGGRHARVALAALLRCRAIIQKCCRTKFRKRHRNVLADLATWVAALTTQGGGNAFSNVSTKQLKDDTKKDGLLDAAQQCDSDSLTPAINAARGKSQTGGRLVWEVSLPEAIQHCEEAKLAVIMPEWDVRRGRTHIDYSGKEIQMEMFAGKSTVFSGPIQTAIDLNESGQRPIGDWEASCEFSDDDIHYLEVEQLWSGDLILQRQFMVVRDDRCVLMADSVLPSSTSARTKPQELRYTCRYPLAAAMQATPEAETREFLLGDKRTRAVAYPLAASEWRVGPTAGTLRVTDDNHLLLTLNGKDRLYAPLWLDFQRARFKRNRTWRQLTVADDLQIVDHCDAVGFRIQAGPEQWLVYRSLGDSRCRSVLGKHLIADFYAGRFYINDGSIEELVTVDDTQD